MQIITAQTLAHSAWICNPKPWQKDTSWTWLQLRWHFWGLNQPPICYGYSSLITYSCVPTIYPVTYFDCITAFEALYWWTSVKDGAHTSFADILQKCIWTSLATELQRYSTLNVIKIPNGIIFDRTSYCIMKCGCIKEATTLPVSTMISVWIQDTSLYPGYTRLPWQLSKLN